MIKENKIENKIAIGFNLISEEVTKLRKENSQLKLKLCLMREYIYGNYEPEIAIEKIKEIDEKEMDEQL